MSKFITEIEIKYKTVERYVKNEAYTTFDPPKWVEYSNIIDEHDNKFKFETYSSKKNKNVKKAFNKLTEKILEDK